MPASPQCRGSCRPVGTQPVTQAHHILLALPGPAGALHHLGCHRGAGEDLEAMAGPRQAVPCSCGVAIVQASKGVPVMLPKGSTKGTLRAPATPSHRPAPALRSWDWPFSCCAARSRPWPTSWLLSSTYSDELGPACPGLAARRPSRPATHSLPVPVPREHPSARGSAPMTHTALLPRPP